MMGDPCRFWTSFPVARLCLAGFPALQRASAINNTLISLGIIDTPIQMLQTNFAVYLALVYTYLPFMILPLYGQSGEA